jgi:hypothetical protein
MSAVGAPRERRGFAMNKRNATDRSPRRDVFLAIALLVAEGLPEPSQIRFYDDWLQVDLAEPSHLQAWGDALGAGPIVPMSMPDHGLTLLDRHVRTHASGWRWWLRSEQPIVRPERHNDLSRAVVDAIAAQRSVDASANDRPQSTIGRAKTALPVSDRA